MKIAFIRESGIQNLNPDTVKTLPLSATDTGFIYLADELSVFFEVKVFCPIQDKKTYRGKGTVEYLPLPSKKGVGCEQHLSSHLLKYKPDVVIVVGNPRLLMLPFLNPYKKIFWLHNHPLEMGKYNQYLYKASQSGAIQIVTSSKESMDYARSYYHNSKIFGIYNGIRKVFFSKAIKKECDKIVYVGPLSPSKGALEFLKAAISLKDYKFYVCGSFDMYGYTIPGYAEACGLYEDDHITHLGGLIADDLSYHMSSAQLCVVNPIVGNLETCCVSALEAMATETPVLAGGNSLIEPIIKKGGICYTSNLANTIKYIMEKKVSIPNGVDWARGLSFPLIALKWKRLIESFLCASI